MAEAEKFSHSLSVDSTVNFWDGVYHLAPIFTQLIVNGLICIASIVAARRQAFRSIFCLFAVAAGLSVISATIVIFFRPYAYFSFSFASISINRGILLLQPIADFTRWILYGVGFVALARRVLATAIRPTDA